MNFQRNIYALRDNVAMKFRDIICDDSIEEAKRNLSFAVNNDAHFAFMAKDLQFCHIGVIDMVTGVIDPIIPCNVVCNVSDLLGVNE